MHRSRGGLYIQCECERGAVVNGNKMGGSIAPHTTPIDEGKMYSSLFCGRDRDFHAVCCVTVVIRILVLHLFVSTVHTGLIDGAPPSRGPECTNMIEASCHKCRPASLVIGTAPAPGFRVEILVEKQHALPSWLCVHLCLVMKNDVSEE